MLISLLLRNYAPRSNFFIKSKINCIPIGIPIDPARFQVRVLNGFAKIPLAPLLLGSKFETGIITLCDAMITRSL